MIAGLLLALIASACILATLGMMFGRRPRRTHVDSVSDAKIRMAEYEGKVGNPRQRMVEDMDFAARYTRGLQVIARQLMTYPEYRKRQAPPEPDNVATLPPTALSRRELRRRLRAH